MQNSIREGKQNQAKHMVELLHIKYTGINVILRKSHNNLDFPYNAPTFLHQGFLLLELLALYYTHLLQAMQNCIREEKQNQVKHMVELFF
jgi:hypothetical protein